MKTLNIKAFCVLTLFTVFQTPLLAEPTVTEGTITWPDGDWYQVQHSNDFATVCQGSIAAESSPSGGPCIPGNGSYIVINHSTGERFDTIQISGESIAVGTVRVEGNRISWPNNGWYQVQNAETLTSVCEGGLGCDVASGNYVVINHTTGERFDNIRAGLEPEPGSSESLGVTVEGQVLSWPDNGWYQVQEAQTFNTVCEGGTRCAVPDGQYRVINLTTGERSDVIDVGEAGVAPVTPLERRVAVDGNTIRWIGDGWTQVQNAETFESICNGGLECEVASGSYVVIDHTTSERIVLTVPRGRIDTPSLPSIRTNFSITVPAYRSNELQVHVAWGDTELQADWVVDESWSAVVDLPASSENRLIVTFSDQNGALTLGSFETSFTTGEDAPEFFAIQASDFDVSRWDRDGDGLNNLHELITGSDPLSFTSETPTLAVPDTVTATLDIVPTKTFRVSWEPSSRATYYQILENPTGTSGFVTVSPNLPADARFYDHRVPLFKRLNARYVVEACNVSGCTSSTELFVAGTLESGVGTITASDPEESISQDVAISADGQTLAIRATRSEPTDELRRQPFLGSVYIYTLNAGVWQQQARVVPNIRDIGDFFGTAIRLSRDGTVLAVGAQNEESAASGINGDASDDSLFGAGAAYIFTLTDGSWQQEAYIKPSEPARTVYFGRELDLSADGRTLVVTAPFDRSGAVFVFVRTDSGWQQQAKLMSERSSLSNSFVSLSENGDTLATGGIPHVFSRRDGTWHLDTILEREAIGALRGFGSSGTLSDDGKTLVIGADNDGSRATGINPTGEERFVNATLDRAGALHVFVLADGNWVQQAYIKPSVAENYTYFGDAVSISSDGDTLAVVSRDNTVGTGIFNDYTTKDDTISNGSPSRTGSVYIYRRSFGTWTREAYVKAAQPLTRFWGAPVLDGTGDTLVIQGSNDEGVVYIY